MHISVCIVRISFDERGRIRQSEITVTEIFDPCGWQEIDNTLKFDKEEKDRTLKEVLDAFDAYCQKNNETVEGFKFNMRKQEPGDAIETFTIDLKT